MNQTIDTANISPLYTFYEYIYNNLYTSSKEWLFIYFCKFVLNTTYFDAWGTGRGGGDNGQDD